MKMKNILTKIIATVSVAAMVMTGMSTTASAATPTIDTSKDVSLTITKYAGDNYGLSSDLTGTTADAPSGYEVLAGVDFTVVKVADLVQGESISTDIALEYKLTAQGASITSLGKENDIVTSQAFNNYISSKTAEDLSAIKTAENAVTVTTDANGQAVFSTKTNLKTGQGLYLVVETNAPKEVTKYSAPFFASLPMTSKTEANDWIYDVYAYPKNSVATTGIDKKITAVNDDANNGIATGNITAEAQIGDVITYQVPITAVVPDAGLTELYVKDVMSKGLTFVQAGDKAASKDVTVYDASSKVVDSANYTVETAKNTDGTTTLTVAFTKDYIATLNAAADKNPKFTFEYKATLNKDAVLGVNGNTNAVKFVYNYVNGPEGGVSSPTMTTKVFTWGIDITKIGESKETKLKDVTFELTANNGDKPMTFAYDEAKGAYTPSASGNTTLTTDANGKIVIRGLERGTYSLKETKTNKGYVLLKKPVEIKIVGDNANVDGSATAVVGGKNVTLQEDGTSLNAIIPVAVVNHKGFELPVTGDLGTSMFTMLGVAMVVIVTALLVMRRRKNAQ